MNTEIIAVRTTEISGEQIQTCNARELHAFMSVGSEFSHWFKRNCIDYGFSEGVDYVTSFLTVEEGGTGKHEFHISFDMAKEISMVSRTAKGKEARQYFLECERIAKQLPALSPAQALHQMTGLMVEQERRIVAVEKEQAIQSDKVKRVEAKQQAFEEGSKYFTVVGYINYRGLDQRPLGEYAKLGKRATALSK